MFLFGSVAETYPHSYRGADLDVGFELEPGTVDAAATERELRRLLASLPTVRPVDAVDFSKVSEDFRERALRRTVDLPTDQ